MAKKQIRPVAKPVEVLEPENPTVALVESEGSKVNAFIRNVAAFFTEAARIEKSAAVTLASAKGLGMPKTMAQDADVQAFIRKAAAEKRAALEHFEPATNAFHNIHRKLTSARAQPVVMLDEAASIGQRLHNAYAEQERRRAAEEQDRVRRQAEEAARVERDRELREAEQKALDLEAASSDLSEREQHFVRLVADNNQPPRLAAYNAGFKNPDQQAQRLMALPKIVAAIGAAMEALAIRRQVEAKREEPLDVEVPLVKPNISKGGGHDRTTHGAECFDVTALVMAVIAGKHGIPPDVLTVNPVKLNEYGRSLRELVNRWPGVRYTKNTTTV
jgi:hypothetical protein